MQILAYLLVVLGTVSLLLAATQYARRVHYLVELGLKRRLSIGFPVAVLLVLIGGFALTALVAEL